MWGCERHEERERERERESERGRERETETGTETDTERERESESGQHSTTACCSALQGMSVLSVTVNSELTCHRVCQVM